MSKSYVYYNNANSISEIAQTLNQLESNKDVESILMLVADQSSSIKDELKQEVQKVRKNLFGGFFPKIVHNNDLHDEGCVLVGLPFQTKTYKIDNISDTGENLEKQLISLSEQVKQTQTMFVYVDGLSSGIGELIEGVYNYLGADHKYMGGGAGSLSFEQSPCLITNEGVFQDCALLVETHKHIGVGVSHGWKKLAGPFRVTESKKNKIISLDWEPAFKIYKEVVEDKSGQKFNQDNFFDLAKGFPFGINKIDSEVVVRDPIIAEGDELVCVGDVPENEYVHILIGTEGSLVGAAAQAKECAVNKVSQIDPSSPLLLMDCISRVLFLEKNFSKELQAIKGKDGVLVGALCLGEIANSGTSCLEFFNKTCVVGQIGEAA